MEWLDIGSGREATTNIPTLMSAVSVTAEIERKRSGNLAGVRGFGQPSPKERGQFLGSNLIRQALRGQSEPDYSKGEDLVGFERQL